MRKAVRKAVRKGSLITPKPNYAAGEVDSVWLPQQVIFITHQDVIIRQIKGIMKPIIVITISLWKPERFIREHALCVA